jgi:dTDP-glucose 4,6-dehydratase
MKYLITGGAGFIGGEFVRRAYNNGLDIAVVDKLTYAGDTERIDGTLEKINFYNIDIVDENKLKEVFIREKPDIVIHFAAETHVDRSIFEPKQFALTNVIGTINLLELSRNHNLQLFIHISTDEVYGEILPGVNYRFTELDPLLANSPYSASKSSADIFVRAFSRTYKLPVIIIRPSNTYGPWQYPEKLIPLAISKALVDEKIPVYGEGKNIRTWLYVSDCVEAIFEIIKRGKVGETYNVGSKEEHENIVIVKKIIQLMGKDESLIEYVPDRPGHDFRYSLDISKIKEHTGWKPKVSFETGLELTVNWYLENREWAIKKKIQSEELFKEIRSSYNT